MWTPSLNASLRAREGDGLPTPWRSPTLATPRETKVRPTGPPSRAPPPMPTTPRPTHSLPAQLQSSLLAEHDVDLAGAIREHRATTRGNEPDLATAISEHRELVRRRVEHEQPEREFGLIRALDRRSRDRRRRAAAYEQALDRL